jgi:phosphatidylserine decarboxylase
VIARDGWTFILIGLVATVVLLYVATRWDNKTAFVFGLIFALVTVFVAFFFRDPERSFKPQPGLVVSPADGKIVLIDTLPNHDFVGSNTIQVSIFLSIIDVHVNRLPVDGMIEYVKYNPGKFLAAYEDKASEVNEQTEIGLITDAGQRLSIKQIAGIIARRVVCRVQTGDRAVAGERFGLIRFGSRTDVLLPADSRLAVKLGDRVKGGESPIGFLAPSEPPPQDSEAQEGSNAQL